GAVTGGLPLAGDRHPDRGGDALSKRTGGRLDPRGPAVLGMAGGARAELAEALDVRERDRGLADHLVVGIDRPHPGEVQQRVEQHRSVAGREDEAVAAGPDWIVGVEAQEALPERVGDRRQRHRRAGVPGGRPLDRAAPEGAERVERELIDVAAHWLDPSHEPIPAGVPLNFFGGESPAVASSSLPKKYKTFHPYRNRLKVQFGSLSRRRC